MEQNKREQFNICQIGATFQILPFFVIAKVIGKLLAGNKELVGYLLDCAVMAAF